MAARQELPQRRCPGPGAGVGWVTRKNVLSALSHIALQIRTRLGESLATVREHSTPLEQATTSSLEALEAYSAAQKSAVYAYGFPRAIPHLRRAIAIDPQFAMAHADLGFFSGNMGQTDLGAEEIRKAYALRDRVSDRERLYILMLYDRQVTGNLQKEMQTLEAWIQAYPRDIRRLNHYGGLGGASVRANTKGELKRPKRPFW